MQKLTVLLGSIVLLTALVLPLSAEAQVLDTLNVTPDSTSYAVEVYFVKADTASFFEPHGDDRKVERLIERTDIGLCRATTVMRAANQRGASELAKRYDAEAINTRLLIRCDD
jgi:hypothetical protein